MYFFETVCKARGLSAALKTEAPSGAFVTMALLHLSSDPEKWIVVRFHRVPAPAEMAAVP